MSRQFPINKREFVRQVGTIECDYTGDKAVKFDALAKAITDMTQGKVNSAEGHKELLEAIRSMIEFFQSG